MISIQTQLNYRVYNVQLPLSTTDVVNVYLMRTSGAWIEVLDLRGQRRIGHVSNLEELQRMREHG